MEVSLLSALKDIIEIATIFLAFPEYNLLLAALLAIAFVYSWIRSKNKTKEQ